jgi:hypothetical protein
LIIVVILMETRNIIAEPLEKNPPRLAASSRLILLYPL